MEGKVEHRRLARLFMNQLVLKARGPTLSLAVAAIQQYPQFLMAGMPITLALHETLRNVMCAARAMVMHCVDTERHAFVDFIKLCFNLESQIGQLVHV